MLRHKLLGRRSLDPQFQLGFGSAVQLLVDSRVLAIKVNITTGAVGITFEDDVNILGNAKELAELVTDKTSA